MNRRGAALLTAVAALLALGVLGALALSAARLQVLQSQRAMEQVASAGAAQAGMARLIAQWPTLRPDTLPPSGIMSGGTTGIGPFGTSRDTVLRLGRALFMARVTGERRDAGGTVRGRDRAALLLRIALLRLRDSAAAWVSGVARVRDQARLSGGDTVPPRWTGACDSLTGREAAAVSLPSIAGLDSSGCTTAGCLTGNPIARIDSALAGTAALEGSTPESLFAMADTVVEGIVPAVSPASIDSLCSVGAPLNWGDPDNPGRPCFDYLPLVGARSGTGLGEGTGQGVLVADGDLVLEGSFRYYGLIVARGSLRLRGQSQVVGGVLVGEAPGDSLVVEGEARVLRSRCAVARALARAGRPTPIASRAWWRWF
jgi:hypothetical protein